MHPLHLRTMEITDIGFADSVRTAAGWNQTTQDWERLRVMEPDGCFVAEWEGLRAGTATTTTYGSSLAWIGMVLVHPDFRRHGIGKALLLHCLHHLDQKGVRCVKLDATPMGKTLYDQLGFKDEIMLARWEASPLPSIPPMETCASKGIRAFQNSDLPAVIKLDTSIIGVERSGLLGGLVGCSRKVLVASGTQGVIQGFGMIRPGIHAISLGPVMALDPQTGTSLIHTLLADVMGKQVYWDILDTNREAVDLASKLGFVRQRPLIRMYRGAPFPMEKSISQFAIADPAAG